MGKGVRAGIVIVPFLVMLILGALDRSSFGGPITDLLSGLTLRINDVLRWAYVGVGVAAVIVVVLTCITGLGDVKIGGRASRRILRPGALFAFALAATTSLGLIYWAAAEPLHHFHNPPASSGIRPMSGEAARFARSATFMHWSVVGFSIMTVFAVGFGLAMQNVKVAPSLEAMIFGPVEEGQKPRPSRAAFIDGTAVFFATFGLVAALASCTLALVQALAWMGTWSPSLPALGALTAAVTALFGLIALQRPNQAFATIAIWTAILMALAIVLLCILGSTREIVGGGARSILTFLYTFPSAVVLTGYGSGDTWPLIWRVNAWGGWMVWAPIIGLFLGRMVRGYTVREAVVLVGVCPAIFCIIWIAALGGLTLGVDQGNGGGLWAAVARGSTRDALFGAIAALRASGLLSALFTLLILLCFVTFAAAFMRGVILISVEPTAHGQRHFGFVLGLVFATLSAIGAFLVLAYGRADLLQAVFNLGAIPALILTIGALYSVCDAILNPTPLDVP